MESIAQGSFVYENSPGGLQGGRNQQESAAGLPRKETAFALPEIGSGILALRGGHPDENPPDPAAEAARLPTVRDPESGEGAAHRTAEIPCRQETGSGKRDGRASCPDPPDRNRRGNHQRRSGRNRIVRGCHAGTDSPDSERESGSAGGMRS